MSGRRWQAGLRHWWQGRSGRERRVLGAWSGALLVLAAWFGVLSPLFGRIASLEQRIPVLEAQLIRMREPVAGRREPGPAGRPGEDLRGALARLLAEQQLGAELRALSGQRVEIRLPALPAKAAFDLLDGLRRASAARVVALVVETASAASASVSVVAELDRLP